MTCWCPPCSSSWDVPDGPGFSSRFLHKVLPGFLQSVLYEILPGVCLGFLQKLHLEFFQEFLLKFLKRLLLRFIQKLFQDFLDSAFRESSWNFTFSEVRNMVQSGIPPDISSMIPSDTSFWGFKEFLPGFLNKLRESSRNSFWDSPHIFKILQKLFFLGPPVRMPGVTESGKELQRKTRKKTMEDCKARGEVP